MHVRARRGCDGATGGRTAKAGERTAMIVDCAHYREGRRQDAGAIPLEEAAARCRLGGFVWLGVVEPQPEELDEIRENFGLHELAVEDAQSYHLRPKIEQYEGDVNFVILRTARYDSAREEVDFGEISVFVGPTFVIPGPQGPASALPPARLRLEERPALRPARGAALWA